MSKSRTKQSTAETKKKLSDDLGKKEQKKEHKISVRTRSDSEDSVEADTEDMSPKHQAQFRRTDELQRDFHLFHKNRKEKFARQDVYFLNPMTRVKRIPHRKRRKGIT